MLNHTVLFRFNEETSEENRVAVVEGLRRLETEIPEVRTLRVEQNIGRPTNFDVILMVQFDNQEDYARYGPHEYHQRLIKEVLTPNVKEIVGIQF